jgi:Flp pilus assembly protein TadG
MFNQMRNEKGQAIVILAIAMVMLLLFAALAIDGGNLFVVKRQTQNASDAGSLAGARQLVLECAKLGMNPGPNESNIRNQVLRMASANNPGSTAKVYYVDANGQRLSQNEVGTLGVVPCSCGNRAMGIEVVVHGSAPAFIAGLIGRTKLEADSTAKARFGAVAQVTNGLYPFTRRNMPMTFNQQVTLRVLDNGEDLPGNFGWLSWDGSNATSDQVEALTPPGTSYKYYNPGQPPNWVADPNDHTITVGKWIQGKPGNKNANGVLDQLDKFISTQTPMMIPLYDAVMGSGTNSNYRVVSFAAFVLKSYDFTGKNKSMTGTFIKWVTNGDWGQGIPCNEEAGAYSVKLIQ